MFIRIRNVNYYYSDYSDNSTLPYLVLLHGFMGSSQAFGHLLPSLRKFCNPISIDLLGHGTTEAPDDPDRYSVTEQIEDLKSLFTELGLHKFVLLGYSMGGRLALQFTTKYPEFISGLILESTTYGIDEPEEVEKRLAVDRDRASAINRNYRDFLESWSQNPLFKRYERLETEAKMNLEQIQKNQKPSGLANSLLGFGTASMSSVHRKLKEIRQSTLIITGEDDEKFTKIGLEMNKLIPESRIIIIPGCGHRVHMENPDDYIQYIRSFIVSKQKGLV